MSEREPINDRPVRLALGKEGFARVTNVSRETLARLEAYVELLKTWNSRINLVGRDTMGDVWRRHVLDSAQVFPHIPGKARVLADFGSGAGLPGLILAIMGVPEVHLVESDLRKAAFLREAIRITGAPATLHPLRAEKVKPFAADVVTARALAALPDLLAMTEPFLARNSLCLFLKGRSVDEELTALGKSWKVTVQRFPSVSDPSGTLLRLENPTREP